MNQTELNQAIQDDIDVLKQMTFAAPSRVDRVEMCKWVLNAFVLSWVGIMTTTLIKSTLNGQLMAQDPMDLIFADGLFSTILAGFFIVLPSLLMHDVTFFKHNIKDQLKTGRLLFQKIKRFGWGFFCVLFGSLLVPGSYHGKISWLLIIASVLLYLFILKRLFDRELGVFFRLGLLKEISRAKKRLSKKGLTPI